MGLKFWFHGLDWFWDWVHFMYTMDNLQPGTIPSIPQKSETWPCFQSRRMTRSEMARTTASVRSLAPSFDKMAVMWVLMVDSLVPV